MTVALKNGWLPLNDANTDWQVNSEGWVIGRRPRLPHRRAHHRQPDEQYGIDTINALSSFIWTAMR